MSYCFFQSVLEPYDTKGVSIETLAKQVQELSEEKQKLRDERDLKLLNLLGNATRFQDMKICCYVDHVHTEKESQFSAMTTILNEKELFVSYRGTDLSLVGWKEDFNMTHKELVPAQIASSSYLLYVAQNLEGSIRIGGHSKGGNLAVFSAAVAPDFVKERLISISTYDGPGFHHEMLAFEGYQKIVPLVKAFVPQSSVIGLMLAREEPYYVVASQNKGLMQHDPYSWGISGVDFVYLESVTKGSQFFDKTLKNWLEVLPRDKREIFFDAFYTVASTHYGDDKGELVFSKRNAYRTIYSLRYEDEETREIILEGFRLYWEAFCKTTKELDISLKSLISLGK